MKGSSPNAQIGIYCFPPEIFFYLRIDNNVNIAAVFHEIFKCMKTEYVSHACLYILLFNGDPNKIPHNERSHWINRSKCEVCMACDLPLLSYSLGEKLEQYEEEIIAEKTELV